MNSTTGIWACHFVVDLGMIEVARAMFLTKTGFKHIQTIEELAKSEPNSQFPENLFLRIDNFGTGKNNIGWLFYNGTHGLTVYVQANSLEQAVMFAQGYVSENFRGGMMGWNRID